MSLKNIKHRKKKPAAKGRRTPTQRQTGKRGWPDYDERENIFYTPHERPYAEVLTIRSPAAAEESVSWMREEFKRASGKKKGFTQDPEWEDHIHKAMDNTAKRAEMSMKRPSILKDKGKPNSEYKEMKQVATIYKKALASPAFDNYYGQKRTKTREIQSGQGKGKFPVKGRTAKTTAIKAGDEILKFRVSSLTRTGRRAILWKPFRMLYKSGNKKNVNAKVKELKSAGFPTRIIRDGKMHYVYAHQEGRGKWKYQPADQWFFKAMAKKGAAFTAASSTFSKAKKSGYRKKASGKARIKAAEKAGVISRGDYKLFQTEKGTYKIVTKKQYEQMRKAKLRKAKAKK